MNMQKVKTLIDKASKVCGSQTALSARLKLHKSQLSEMKHGTRHIPPGIAILIADIANENVADAALAAIIEDLDGTERGEQVKAVLGKALLAGVLVLSGMTNSSAAGGVTIVTAPAHNSVNNIYIVEYVMRLLTLISQRLSLVIRWFALKPTR